MAQIAEKTTKKSNPPWSREELILALDLYLKSRQALPGPDSSDVMELSTLLVAAYETTGLKPSPTFRNPNGVSMKLQNFKRFDPLYSASGRAGLQKGNKDEAEVWALFSSKPELLSAVVEGIRGAITLHSIDGSLAASDSGVEEAQEGRVLTRLHQFYERDRGLAARKKKQALARSGALICEACGFDFVQQYGELGQGVIEVHHKTPLHTLRAGVKTRLTDLALLCANCHRLIHSRKQWLSLPELVEAMRGARAAAPSSPTSTVALP